MTPADIPHVSTLSLQDQFRMAMRRLVATVTIITAGDAQGRAGMVATAVMSMSAEPPSLAVGVNRGSGVWPIIQKTGRFSVNLLSSNHKGLVSTFSGKLHGEERFALGEWRLHHTEISYLDDAVVTLFCRVDGTLDYGTHTLFIGAVEDVLFSENETESLLWRNGSLANAVPLDDLLT